MDKPLDIAINTLGSQAALARALGVTPQLVHQWRTRTRPVSAKQAIAIDRVTSGVVSKEQLRPDIFVSQPVRVAGRKFRRR
jgi:DNA-binding transcriptional regulator YdaS (Cro superfamily)